MHVERAGRGGKQIAGLDHAAVRAARERHAGIILDLLMPCGIRHARPDARSTSGPISASARSRKCGREIDGAAAARERRIEHPVVAGRAIALREARDEADSSCTGCRRPPRAAASKKSPLRNTSGTAANAPAACAASRDAGDLAFVQAARLLQRERDFLRDEETAPLGHVAMAAERDDEVRLHARRRVRESRYRRRSRALP